MNQTIPLFPLPLVVFPEQALPLHIFEPRYRQMLADVRAAQDLGEVAPIGICLGEDSDVSAPVGCAVLLEKVLNEYGDGRADIICVGYQRFTVGEISRERSYLMVEASFIEDEEEPLDVALLQRAQQGYTRLLELAQEESGDRFESVVPQTAFQIAQSAALPIEGKQEMLQMTRENERLLFLCSHFDELIPNLESRRAERVKIQSNGHSKGH